jgi:hypothetical protein
MGLDVLLDMEMTTFWQTDAPQRHHDERDLEATLPLDVEATRLVQLDEVDRRLMEPKLRVKAEAMASFTSEKDLFVVRAVQAQIGWLETCLAAVAVQAIVDVELALEWVLPVGRRSHQASGVRL